MSVMLSHLPAGVARAGEDERHGVIGHTLTFTSPGHETDGAAFMWEIQSPPGAVVPPHIHKVEDEFIDLLAGQLEVTIGDQRHAVHPSDLVKLPRNVPHSIRCVGDSAATTFWTVVPAGKMEQLFRALGALPADQPPDPAQTVKIFVEHDLVPLPPEG